MYLMFFILLAIILLLLLLWVYCGFRRRYQYWSEKGVDYLPPTFPFGNIGPLFRGKLGLGDSVKALYNQTEGPFAGVYLMQSPAVIVKDPELIKLILVKDFNHFTDRGIYNDEKRHPTSGHLFKLGGERWRRLRYRLTPAFTAGKLRTMFAAITDVSTNLRQYLGDAGAKGQRLDVDDMATRYAADIIASTIFGIEVNSFQQCQNDFIVMAKDLFVSKSLFRILKSALQLFCPQMLTFLRIEVVKEAQNQFITKLVRDVIDFRRRNGVARQDMMQLLMELRDGDAARAIGPGLTADEITAQAYTFFFAGFETTASTMAFLLYECALDHGLQARLHRSVCDVLARHGGAITYEAVAEMQFLHWAIAETLRKYPILQFLNRIATKDYPLPGGGVLIEKGTRVLISVSGLHHDPVHFPEPDKFDPDRFSGERAAHHHPFAYLPFGEGPRSCIGKRIARTEMAVGIATVIQSYFVDVCEETEIPLKFNQLAYFAKSSTPIVLKFVQRERTNVANNDMNSSMICTQ